jgi:hypothetical protein
VSRTASASRTRRASDRRLLLAGPGQASNKEAARHGVHESKLGHPPSRPRVCPESRLRAARRRRLLLALASLPAGRTHATPGRAGLPARQQRPRLRRHGRTRRRLVPLHQA